MNGKAGKSAPDSLERQVEILSSKARPPLAILLGSPGQAAALIAALPSQETTCYQMDLYAADRQKELLAEQGSAAQVVAAADAWDLPGTFASVILIAPATGERILKLDMVEQGFHLTRPGGTFFVLSPYSPDSFFPAQLKKIFGAVHASVVGDSTVFWCTRKSDRPRRRHEVVFHARDGERPSREFLSRPGVFSYGKLDDGTRALMDCMAIEPGEQILDVGCGCGAAGIFAGIRGGSASRVTFVDSNTRAIAVTNWNAERNGLIDFQSINAWRPESLKGGSADVVLANPPYFGGTEIATRFIEYARHALKPKGRLYLVTKLTELFGDLLMEAFEELAAEESRGYIVFSARGQT